MRPIIIVMLIVQIAIFIVTAVATLTARAERPRARSLWSSLAFALVIISATSWQIADKHETEQGADLLHYGSPLLLGMALMCALMMIWPHRHRYLALLQSNRYCRL